MCRQPYDIRVAQHYFTTHTNVKDKDHTKSNVLTVRLLILGRLENLKTRLTEHKRETKNGDIRNHISEHHRPTKHKIDWDSAECITYSTNYQQNDWTRTSEPMSTATCTLQTTHT